MGAKAPQKDYLLCQLSLKLADIKTELITLIIRSALWHYLALRGEIPTAAMSLNQPHKQAVNFG